MTELRVDAAIADIEDDLMLQLTASGFEVTQVDDEVAAVEQAQIEEKARRAAARKSAVRSDLLARPPPQCSFVCDLM